VSKKALAQAKANQPDRSAILIFFNMSSIWQSMMAFLRRLFFSKEIEITLVGLQNSGKTSLVNCLTAGQFSEEMVPTVGFGLKIISKGNVKIKMWDLGGQTRFRSMWSRYCRGVSAVVFVLDSADVESLPQSREELHTLLAHPALSNIPVLILGNKNDLPNALSVQDVIEGMALASIDDRECSCYSISCKSSRNIDVTLDWLLKRS